MLIVGAIAAATMIVPGISGSLVLMNIGYYEGIIGAVKGLTDFSNFGHNCAILLPFGIGVIVGIVLIARLIKFLLNRFHTQTYFAIFAFVLASIFGIIYNIDGDFRIVEFIVGILLLIAGATLTFFIARHDSKENNTNENSIVENEKMIE